MFKINYLSIDQCYVLFLFLADKLVEGKAFKMRATGKVAIALDYTFIDIKKWAALRLRD